MASSVGCGRLRALENADGEGARAPRGLYDEDLLAWAEQQAELLRVGQLDRLDVANLIDELEAIAGKLRRELKNRLRILLAHLLKWEHQPRRRSRSRATSIAEQRDQISALLEENPSLRPHLETLAVSVYPRAVRLAAIETGLRRDSFPKDLPYDLRAMLGDEDEPDEPVSA